MASCLSHRPPVEPGRPARGSLLDHLLSAGPAGLALFDLDGRYATSNRALLGDLPVAGDIDQLVGRPISDVLPELGADAEADFRRVVLTGRPVRNRSVTAAASGHVTERSVLATWMPVHDDRGRLLSVAACVVEGSERAALAAALEGEKAARTAAEEAQRRLAFLAEASRRLSASFDRSELLADVARLAVPRLSDWAAVYVPDGQELQRVAMFGRPEHESLIQRFTNRHAYPVDSETPVATAFRTAATVVVDDAAGQAGAGAPEEVAQALRELGIGSAMCVPVVATTGAVAVLSFANEGRDRPFDHHDVALAEDVAGRLCVALDRVSHHEREHEIAHTLVRAALPSRLPDIEGLELDVRYLPGGPGGEVGGDWYDAFVVDGRVMLVVGDVAGHGIPAATGMAQLRNAIRAYAVQGLDPPGVLAAAGRLAHDLDDASDDPFVIATVLVMSYDPGSGSVTWANAGHPSALVVGDRRADYLDLPRGPLLGACRDVTYENGTTILPPGGTMALYTDGLIEHRTERLDVGRRRLFAAMTGNRWLPVPELCDAVLRDANLPDGRDDDCCLLVVRRSPAPG